MLDSNRLNIVTTNNLMTIFRFHQKRAFLTEGRGFTPAEYREGAKVCVIDTALAERNGLSVGDVIPLEIFGINTVMREDNMWHPGGYEQGTPVNPPEYFTIVGLFTGGTHARGVNDPNDIPFNTVFIPDRALDFGDEHDVSSFMGYWPLLRTIVLPNGGNEAFREAIEALLPGYAGFFTIYDQGYAHVRGASVNLLENAQWVLLLSAAGWGVSGLVFVLFYILRKRREAGLLYAMGINGRRRFVWVFMHCVLVVALSQVLALTAAANLYGWVWDYAVAETAVVDDAQDRMFSDQSLAADGAVNEFLFRREPLAIPVAAAAQAGTLLLVSCGVSAAVARKGTRNLRRAVD
jgi:hypothetical protein